ncbi:MAG: flagellar motor protein MotB [Nocardioidaceae bacterium]
MAASRRRRHEPEEAHGNHERWLITYADMITLLMVLFIVLFAVSQVDQKRFEALKEGLSAGFGETSSPFEGSQAVMPEPGTLPMAPVQPVSLDGPRLPQAEQQPGTAVPEEQTQDRYAAAVAEVNRLDELRRRIAKALRERGFEDDVRMSIDHRGLSVSLVSRHIVFAPNVADLTPRGVQVLDVLAPVLRSVPDKLDIDGHTNQVKVKPKYYPTDWELSAARAVAVLRHLNERGGIHASRLSAVAFGHEKPLIDPSRPGSQTLNKRVDIVVLSSADEATRALFDEVLRDRDRL